MRNDSLDLEMGDDLETILTRLAETIAWCVPRVNQDEPRTCLRSPALRPHPLERNRKAVVGSVAVSRYMGLKHPKKCRASDLANGRLLIYEPDINLAHGLEEGETNGYVDIDNIPPWDTWVAYIYEGESNYLLSWVPPQFVALVTSGIQVSPEECFRWLDRTEFKLKATLGEGKLF